MFLPDDTATLVKKPLLCSEQVKEMAGRVACCTAFLVCREGQWRWAGRFGPVMEIVAGIGHNANMATRRDARFGSTRLV